VPNPVNMNQNYLDNKIKKNRCYKCISASITFSVLFSIIFFPIYITTRPNDFDFDQFTFIKNYEVKSDGYILQGFGYDKNLDYGNIRYDNEIKFDGNSVIILKSSLFKLNNATDLSNANNFLCPEDTGLLSFKLNFNNKDNTFYEYKCVKLNLKDSNLNLQKDKCDTLVTYSLIGGVDFKTFYRINIGISDPPPNFKDIFRGFKLNSKSITGTESYEFYYEIYYCRYQYTTIKQDIEIKTVLDNKIIHETKSINYNEGDINDLTKLFVFCELNKVLNGFKLTKVDNIIKYNYNCIPINKNNLISNTITSRIIKEYKTPLNDIQSVYASTNFLDRHTVLCEENSALIGFYLNSAQDLNMEIYIAYEYICLKMNNLSKENCKENNTPETEGADRSKNLAKTEYLTRQSIHLKSNEVLVGFRLITRNEKNNFPIYKYWY